MSLTDVDAAAMRDVRDQGLAAARHLRGDIYEVRANGDRQTFRILFAPEGSRGQVLLSLEAFSKKTQRTPPEKIGLAERRLAEWRRRGRLSQR
jgi:phage-related protein